MENKVIDILADYACIPRDEIKPSSKLQQDLKLNSLDVINIVVEFEEAFNIEIMESDIRSFSTVQDLMDYLKDVVVPGGAAAHA